MRALHFALLAVLAATALFPPACKRAGPPAITSATNASWSFPEDGVTIEADFPRARLNECTRLGPDEYGLVIRPENLPVNNSPWFAFRVRSSKPKTVTLRMRCQGGDVRYTPKISTDGTQWVTLPKEAYEEGPHETECTLQLEAGPSWLWVAAQEPVSRQEMRDWALTLERLPYVTFADFGESLGKRALFKLDLGNPNAKRHVSIIGRQHPPETTGSLALMRFVEELVSDSDLARDFRQEFHVLVIPMINPDGVDLGHWRHNLGRVDLNRDWGLFAQPETKAAAEQITALGKQGRLFLHLDFHSTFKDVFYTQGDDAPGPYASFTKRWLAGIQKRVPDYEVRRSASPTPTTTTSAYWSHLTFKIPGITYEIGDDTDRATLKRVAANAAQEMMTLLLEMKDIQE